MSVGNNDHSARSDDNHNSSPHDYHYCSVCHNDYPANEHYDHCSRKFYYDRAEFGFHYHVCPFCRDFLS